MKKILLVSAVSLFAGCYADDNTPPDFTCLTLRGMARNCEAFSYEDCKTINSYSALLGLMEKRGVNKKTLSDLKNDAWGRPFQFSAVANDSEVRFRVTSIGDKLNKNGPDIVCTIVLRRDGKFQYQVSNKERVVYSK